MRRPSWLRRLLLRLAGEPLPPRPSDRAAAFLAAEDAWPWAPTLERLRRWLRGQPDRSPLDSEAMRADAVRIGERIGRSAERNGPTGTVDAGLQGLVARTLERIQRTGRRQSRQLAWALGRATLAQALLNRRQGALEDADGEIALRRREIPEPPRLGVALTGRFSHVVVVGLLLVPLEAFLTFPTLQILTYDDLMTQRLCVLIGLGIALGAEAAATMLAHVARDGERHDPSRRGLYYVTALLAVAAIVGGAVTLDQMARARVHNEALAYAIEQGQSSGAASSGAGATGTGSGGFAGVPGGTAGAGSTGTGSAAAGGGGFAGVPGGTGAAGTGAAATGAAGAATLSPAPGTPDLRFMLGLQLFAFIAAVIFALRVHVAAPYRTALRRLAAAERRVRRRNWAVSRADRRTTRTRAALDEAQRDVRSGVREELDGLRSLLERARERHDQQFPDGGPPPMELPIMPDLEQLVAELLDPERAPLGQPEIDPPPLGDPPPRGQAPGPEPALPFVAEEPPRRARAVPDDEPPPEPAEDPRRPARDNEMSDLLERLERRLFPPPRAGAGGAEYRRTPPGGNGRVNGDGPSEHATAAGGEAPAAERANGAARRSELDDDAVPAPAAEAPADARRSELEDEAAPPPSGAAAAGTRRSELDEPSELDEQPAHDVAARPRMRNELLDDDVPDPDDDPLASVGS
jgi:hypothetical protein